MVFLFIFLAGVVGWRASRALRVATQEVRSEGELRFTARTLPEPQEPDFEAISTPAVFFQAARFLGDLYIAGPAGLSQYNASGTLLKQYAVGRELPEDRHTKQMMPGIGNDKKAAGASPRFLCGA